MAAMVKIDFEIEQDGLRYQDALHLNYDHGLSDAEIESLKLERFVAWQEYIANPPVTVDGPVAEPVEE